MISDKDAYSADVFYHQRCYNKFTWDYKPAESNREDKDRVDKAMAEKIFLTLLKTQVINQEYCFLLQDLLIAINDMYEKNGCEVKITKTKDLKKLITETFLEEIKIHFLLRSSWATPDTSCNWRESYWSCFGFSCRGRFKRCRNYSRFSWNNSLKDKGDRIKDGVPCFTWYVNRKIVYI